MDADVQHMIAAASGDREALGVLYHRYGGLMLAVGLKMMGDRREAEDILHDVFVEAWRRAGDYDPARGSVKTWLLLRMRSRCLDRLRSAAYKRTRPSSEQLEARLEARGGDGSGREDHGLVHRLLGHLPEAQRQVLLLGYFEGLSCSEIAERLEVPIGTVKSRMAAGLTKLRARLAPRETAS